jgi:hypothetical protein
MKKYTFTEKKDTRSGFGAGILEAGRRNENVVALCADLVASLKLDAFIKEFPHRFFQVGIAEANMIGIAAGMTIGGSKASTDKERVLDVELVSLYQRVPIFIGSKNMVDECLSYVSKSHLSAAST